MTKRLPESRVDLLSELAPDVERLYNRHLDSPRDWYPHEQIDWGLGESFETRPWSPDDYVVGEGVRSSIYVNLLTEDNLPYYTDSILSHAPMGHPIRDWSYQWTMEENRHSMIMRDWVHVSRCINPRLLEDGRRVQMTRAEVPRHPDFAEMIAYVSFQERATQIAHRNTGAKLPKEDKMGRNVLGLIAGDETKHYLFYRDLTLAAFAIDPSAMTIAVAKQVSTFAMPGTGIPAFTRHAVRIAREGIYGLGQYLKDVLTPVLSLWDVDHLSGLSKEAEKARLDLLAAVSTVTQTVERMAEKASLVHATPSA
ncbi:MAG: acyl-ACP desaturase [Acidobacteriota bacterium]|nr:acyl-ACP desaturase [Acidobacteriota bacterium]MDE3044422.1 acyl-ACP desaturase [Acidobacteriota bacterium]MDE3107314.1 acyl-ACP desaturase [Acidobacteriota bacterium]